jgi:hypothetical protein
MKHRNKENVRYWQFEGGYAQAWDTQLRALLEGYRLGHFRRNEVRVFAARLEFTARHPNSKRLQLARILNWNSHHKGNRWLSASQIDDAARKLDQYLPKLQVEFEAEWERAERTPSLKPVARAALRHVATGGATTVEALFCLAYFMRRIPQRKPMQRLLAAERYARFRYADFQAWTGVHRATQCRMLRRLIERGYLNIVPVSQQNANAYGQLFVDGPVLSLVRRKQMAPRRKRPPLDARDKRSTPRREKVNAPPHKRSTLIKVNLKKEIEEEEKFVSGLKAGYLGSHYDPELQRIANRAAQMVQSTLRQAA